MRTDQLLHWLCLIKSRSLAARTCLEGRVRVNGLNVKPSRELRVGDRITIHDPLRDRLREIEIVELPAGQVSRREAPHYYRMIGEGGPELFSEDEGRT
ncbi:MAG: S4 domain-containing protein [Candidatus Eisenbacteria bacterium]